jgi:voltage-gated potassium channel
VVTIPIFGQFLSSLRLVRLARLLRFLRAATILGRAVQAERRLSSGDALRFMAVATVFLAVIAGAAEATLNEGEFKTLWDGVWWAFVTVTTVGYGDLYPTTTSGRVIGIVLMLLGLAFLAVLTGTIASRFVRTDSDPQHDAILEALDRTLAESRGEARASQTVTAR